MSHIPVNGLLFGLIFLARKTWADPDRLPIFYRRSIGIFLLYVLGSVSMSANITKSNHVFFMAKMAENGILNQFLSEKCVNGTEFEMCRFKEVEYVNADYFLWDPNSPLHQLGGWKKTQSEFSKIIQGTFSSPEYIWMHIRESLRSGVLQLRKIYTGDGFHKYEPDSRIIQQLSTYFPHHIKAYNHSVQITIPFNSRPFPLLNQIQFGLYVLSMGMILIFLLIPNLRRKLPRTVVIVLILALLAHTITCFANASLVTVAARFSSKMGWMMLFGGLLILYSLFVGETKRP